MKVFRGADLNAKKWFFLFLAALILVVVLLGAFNYALDPFGAFGDRFLQWPGYDMTLNPRNAKPAYLARRLDQFDSYIIGSSSAMALEPELLNGYLDASFYNMFHYHINWSYDEDLVRWLLTHDDVKHIVLVLGINDVCAAPEKSDILTDLQYYEISGMSPLLYYFRLLTANPQYAMEKLRSRGKDTLEPQAFDLLLADTGAYDNLIYNSTPIGSQADYLQLYYDKERDETPKTMDRISDCMAHIAAIRDLCQEAGARLHVILAPACQDQLSLCDSESLGEYYHALSETVDYWNFQISPLSGDLRFFLDDTHIRTAAFRMCLGAMFDDPQVYRPQGFGRFCPRGSVPPDPAALMPEVSTVPDLRTVPILRYNQFGTEELDYLTTPDRFRHHLSLLRDNGYTPVSLSDIEDYVFAGKELPEKPVAITFSDCYQSVCDYAVPVLEEYECPAAIFILGSLMGSSKYKDTFYGIPPRMDAATITELSRSGLICFQSGSYDMGQVAMMETGTPVRESMLPLEGESHAAYLSAVAEDTARETALFAELGLDSPHILCFPGGMYDETANAAAVACGYRMTITLSDSQDNTLVKGLPQSLLELGSMAVSNQTSDEEFLAYLASHSS